MMTILISSVVGLLLIGPVTIFGSTLISEGVLALRSVSPLLAGAVVGGTWQILVIFGLHWGFIPVFINNVLTQGFDNVMMPFFACTFATTGAVAAIWVRTRDRKLKDLSLPAFISGIFGVTEPAIYGILLPLKRPFVISCVVGAIVGGFFGSMDFRKFMLGGIGIFEFPGMIAPDGSLSNLMVGITGAVASLVLAFLITLVLFRDSPAALARIDAAVSEDAAVTAGAPADPAIGTDAAAQGSASKPAPAGTFSLASPLAGDVIALADVSDAVFASGALGQGVAIRPTDGRVTSPFDGRVTALFPTLHAIGLTADDGREALIHIGLDTVQLEGKGFTAHVAAGDVVSTGQLLIEFDPEVIQQAGLSIETPVIITNADRYGRIMPTTALVVRHGDPLLAEEQTGTEGADGPAEDSTQDPAAL